MAGIERPLSNCSLASAFMVGLTSRSSSSAERRSFITLISLGLKWMRKASVPTLRTKNDRPSSSYRGVVHRCRLDVRLADGEAQLRQVRCLVNLAAGGLEQDGGGYAAVDVAQRAAGVGIQGARM